LIARLVVIAMSPSCFAALEAQPRLRPAVITDDIRRKAYPFKDALPVRESNLVTLLAWAEMLAVVPGKKNLFLEAKDAGPRYFANLERDNRRTIRFSLFKPATALSLLVPLLAAIYVTWIAATHPHSFLDPHGWWNVMLFAIPAVVGFGLIFVGDEIPRLANEDGTLSGHWVDRFFAADWGPISDTLFLVAGILLAPGMISLSLCELLRHGVWVFLSVATAAIYFGYYFFQTGIFCEDVVYNVNKRNKFVDSYTDPASAHWLRRPAPVQP
jgi:hypothetical protein